MPSTAKSFVHAGTCRRRPRHFVRVPQGLTLSHATLKRPLSDIYWINTMAQNEMQHITTLYETTRRLFSPCIGEIVKLEEKQIALDRGRATGATEAGTFFCPVR